jgi:predicted RNase H-like nuclease (RuvC/YqgF family)
MINTNTGVIMAYNPEVTKLGLNHIKECTADGIILGAANTEMDEAQAKIAELQFIIDEKNRRITALETYIANLENQLNASGEKQQQRKLEDMSLEELRKICSDLGIVAKGNKNDLISAIVNKGKHEL